MRCAPLLARADSLRPLGVARVHAYLDSLIAVARAGNDGGLEMVVSIRNATIRGFIENDFDAAVNESRRWLAPARAARDTLSLCLALRTIGYADLARERFSPALVTYCEMLDLSRRARLAIPEGYARIGRGYIGLQRGRTDEAERDYRIAIRRLEGRDAFGARTAHAGLANSLYRLGRTDDARREYQRVVADAHAVGDRRNEADAVNDLGAIEFQYGDVSQAAGKFLEAARMHHAMGMEPLALQCVRNAALCLGIQGRIREQEALNDSVMHAVVVVGSQDLLMRCLLDLAAIRRAQGRHRDAAALFRRVLASGDSAVADTRADAAAGLVSAEIEEGQPAAAARVAQQALESLGESARFDARPTLLHALGRARLAAGDVEGALAPLREAIGRQLRYGGFVGTTTVTYEATLAGAFTRLGRRDSALAHFSRAAERWERLRAAPDDLAWREAFDSMTGDLYGPYAQALLDPARGGTAASRAAEAFAMLQRFRSRTLEDELRGAEGRADLPRVSLDALRRSLSPGEVLLDLFPAPDTTLVFAVTRDGIQVAQTTGGDRLVRRLRRFGELAGSADADAAALSSAATSLGAELYGAVGASLRRANTVLISAGRLTAFPLGMLRVPGEPEAIAVQHGFAIVPSATLLVAGRSAAAPARSGLVALSRTTDAGGARLEGVARETRWLARRFPAAQVTTNDGTRPLDAMLQGLGTRAVLHIACHTRQPAEAPWRAGFLLGRGAGEDAFLTASRIARLRNPARVCVLAGCTSVGGTTSAEGLPNLASAWLASGARAVIATLWTVDDQATARFVEDLYGALARGSSGGEAIAAAQRAARASADRSDPRFWSGFVLLGDPTTRVALAPAGR